MLPEGTKLVYIAHPYGGNAANLERAKRWLRWAWTTHGDNRLFIAPWIANCEALADVESAFREAGLTSDCEVVGMCEELWLCGVKGGLTPGMEREKEAAKEMGVKVVLWAAEEPPLLLARGGAA